MPKEKEIIHTTCFKCGKGITKSEGSPVRDEKDTKWLGWGCFECFPENAKKEE